MPKLPASLKEPKWWTEHGVDVMTLFVTIVLAFLIRSLDQSDHLRESSRQDESQKQQRAALNQLDLDQTLAVMQNGAENDAHQAITLLSQFEMETETGHEARRRAVARVIKVYALAGRLYEPPVELFFDPASTECDATAFADLADAIRASANNARRDATSGADKAQDQILRSALASKLQLSIERRTRICGPGITQGAPPAPTGPLLVDIPLGYIDVGCEQTSEADREVSLDTVVKPGYRFLDASADFANTSNVRDVSAKVSPPQSNAVKVHYSMRGLDTQSLPFGIRNCPGGGHGTLVFHARLAPLP